jgi:hypothetical protein
MHHVSSQRMSTRIFTSSTAPSSVVNNCNQTKRDKIINFCQSGQFIMFSRVRDVSISLLLFAYYKNSARMLLSICTHAIFHMIFIIDALFFYLVRNALNLYSIREISSHTFGLFVRKEAILNFSLNSRMCVCVFIRVETRE